MVPPIDGYDDSAYVEGNKFETEAGRFYNQNWAPVSSDYDGKQYWYMYGARTTDRFNKGFLNERENFFHKPLVNLNHFLNINEKTKLSSVLYWSGGSGGGAIFSDGGGSCTGLFTIPDPNVAGNPKFQTGERLFRLTSSETNATNPEPETFAPPVEVTVPTPPVAGVTNLVTSTLSKNG